ncbi:unnamed protein product [Closterium sp. NIES-54]
MHVLTSSYSAERVQSVVHPLGRIEDTRQGPLDVRFHQRVKWVQTRAHREDVEPEVPLRTTLAALGFAPSTADPSLFLRTDTSLPPFYVLVYVDDLVFAIADTAGLAHVKSELQKRHTCTDLGELRNYLGLQITRDRAQELRWLTYLLTDLGEPPHSPPVLYVDNKAMLALCREHRLEHRTKHIALRYFLARELQQRGQLRLSYVASEANIADIFTKALQPCDHQRFCTMLGLVPTWPHLLTS